MNELTRGRTMNDEKYALLRAPFNRKQISFKPQATKAQSACPANEKVMCPLCGGWHHPKVQHLSYVGHAGVTHRLLDVDPTWNWEPIAFDERGFPAFDEQGGLWIRLTICGHTRLGYGNAMHSEFKEVGSREKEVIGDAIRNAAMRFGVALDLWSKADLLADDDDETGSKTVKSVPVSKTTKTVPAPKTAKSVPAPKPARSIPAPIDPKLMLEFTNALRATTTEEELKTVWLSLPKQYHVPLDNLKNDMKSLFANDDVPEFTNENVGERTEQGEGS